MPRSAAPRRRTLIGLASSPVSSARFNSEKYRRVNAAIAVIALSMLMAIGISGLEAQNSGTPGASGEELSVTVRDEVGATIAGVSVLFLAPDGRYIVGKTGQDGEVSLRKFATSKFRVFCGSPGFGGYIGSVTSIPQVNTLEVRLKPLQDGGSLVIPNVSGSVPGLKGRFRFYYHPEDSTATLQADNININRTGASQWVTADVQQLLRTIDADDVRVNLRILAMGGTSFLIDYVKDASTPVVVSPATGQTEVDRTTQGTPNAPVQELSVMVRDDVGTPVATTSVLFLAPDGRYVAGKTGADGLVSLKAFGMTGFRIFCGREGYVGFVGNITPNPTVATLEVHLKSRPSGGSIVISNSTGSIPGLKGRLNPVLDSSERTYIYASDIVINGGEAQPVHFGIGETMRATDADGNRFNLRIVAIGGKSTLIDYSRLATTPAVVSPATGQTKPIPAPGAVTPAPSAGDVLTDVEVNQAIQEGFQHQQGRQRIGLILFSNDVFTIHVYTPEQWIEQMAANSRREMLPFPIEQVTPEMRKKMLHVVAMPSVPHLGVNEFVLSPSVHRIVLADVTGNRVVQPVEPEDDKLTFGKWRTATSAFMMRDVADLRSADTNAEFCVTVVDKQGDKTLRVKAKFFASLLSAK